MVDFVTQKYVNIVGSRLHRFHSVRDHVFRFRCPFCGDSKKNENKTRGHIFLRGDNFWVHCFNCGFSGHFDYFLRLIDTNLYSEYKIEKFRETIRPHQKPEFDSRLLITRTEFNQPAASKELYLGCPVESSVKSLEFLKQRKIPVDFHRYLYFVSDLRKFGNQFEKYTDVCPELRGILFPFFQLDSELKYVMFRSIDTKFFMVLDINDDVDSPKIWGLNRIDLSKRLYVFEGPIDAMMVDNGVALAGVSDSGAFHHINTLTKDVVFVLDNDYRKNRNVMQALQNHIHNNDKVLIYDRRFEFKDFNEAAMAGWSREKIQSYIDQRTFSGLMAQLELASQTQNLRIFSEGSYFAPPKKKTYQTPERIF